MLASMQTLFLLPDYELVSTIIEQKQRKHDTDLQLIRSGIFYLVQNGCKRAAPPTQ